MTGNSGRAGLLLPGLLAVLLAGCGSEAPTPAPVATASASGGPESPPGVALDAARVQLPVVPGRPGVAYFTVTQASGAPRAIVAVHVEGAGRSEIHETRDEQGVTRMQPVQRVALSSGEPVRFAPGGRHVMLFDVQPALKPGGTAEITVTFDNGDKASIAAPVTTIGSGGEETAR